MDPDLGGLIAATIVIVFFLMLERRSIFGFLDRTVFASRRRRDQRPQDLDEGQEFIREAAGGRPPMNADDAEEFKRWLTANVLPYTACTIGSRPASSDQASHIGGRPWLPAGVEWPRDVAGNPMVFLLQVNFSEVPALAEFPDDGLLLFFIASNDRFGAHTNEARDDISVIYAPDLLVAGAAVEPPLRTGQTPFHDPRAEIEGRSMSFAPVAQMRPWSDDWRIDDRWSGWWARGDDAGFSGLVDDADDQPAPESYIGGNPRMIHGDPRSEEGWRDLDRVLLRIGSDDNIHWGDVGVACFLIRRADLLARDFTRVRFTWDSN